MTADNSSDTAPDVKYALHSFRAQQRLVRPPRIKSLLVERPAALAGVVHGAMNRRLTLVCAPSGYGKTTLLAEAYRTLDEQGATQIWINGSTPDSDPARLDSLLCEQLCARIGIETEEFTDFPGLIATIAPTEPIIVLIDNWDFVETQDTNRFFESLLKDCGEAANFVLSSRKVPEIRLQSWRLAGEVTEFTVQDLRLDQGQAWDLLSSRTTLAYSDHLDRLLERTEGWPAGVQLLRLALPRDLGDPALEFSGSREDVSNYLQETLFSRFDRQTQEFLCLLAYLEEPSPELVEAVLPGQGAAERLARIRRQNLFINEVSEGSSVFRFHSLFRDFLLARAEAIAPISRKDICGSASHFFEARGDAVRTIWYAVRSGEQARALSLLERYAEASLVAQGRIRLFTQWVRLLLDDGAELSASVSYWYRWCLVFTGRWEAAAELKHAGSDQRAAIIDAVIGAFSDDQRRMQAAVERWRHVAGDADPFSHAVMFSASSINKMASGNFRSARAEISKAELSIRQTAGGFGRTWVNVLTVLSEIGCGNINEAMRAAERAVEEANKSLLPKAPAARMARMASAVARYWRGDDAGAVEDLACANTERDDHSLPILTLWASAIARELGVYWERRRFEEYPPSVTIDLVAEALAIESQIKSAPSIRRMAERIAEFESKCSAATAISSEANLFDWGLSDERDILSIRLAIAQGDLAAAAAMISPAINRCQKAGRGLSEMRLTLLRSVVLFRQDKYPAALRCLLQQAEKAVEDGLFRPFIELRHLLQPLLPDLFEAGERSALGNDRQGWLQLCTLLDAPRPGAILDAQVKPIGGLEKEFNITGREIEILGFLDLGLSNVEIGRRMGVSLPTVKWHLSNLYSKLNVKNRASAVRFARDNGFA